MNKTDSETTKWAIDTSAGSPILTYEKCSVIQDEQAYFVLGLIHEAERLTPDLQTTTLDPDSAAFFEEIGRRAAECWKVAKQYIADETQGDFEDYVSPSDEANISNIIANTIMDAVKEIKLCPKQ